MPSPGGDPVTGSGTQKFACFWFIHVYTLYSTCTREYRVTSNKPRVEYSVDRALCTLDRSGGGSLRDRIIQTKGIAHVDIQLLSQGNMNIMTTHSNSSVLCTPCSVLVKLLLVSLT